MKINSDYSKYAVIGIFLVLAFVVYLIIKPFIATILASFVLAFAFYPAYKHVKRYVKNSTASALIVSIFIILIFALPLGFIAKSIQTEATVNYVFIKQILATGNFLDGECNDTTVICRASTWFKDAITDLQIKSVLSEFNVKVRQFFVDYGSRIILSVPMIILNFFIMLFIIFYLLKEGNIIVFRIRHMLPMKQVYRKNIFNQLNNVTYAVLYGHILTAMIQAALGVIAFYVFNVSSPILWGLVMFFFALIPFVGTPVVWGPAVLIKFLSDHPYQALGLLIAGIIISTIDNFIKPKIVSNRAKVHPVLVLLGVLGGIYVFGIVGVIIGPVILSIFISFIEIYEEEKIEAKS